MIGRWSISEILARRVVALDRASADPSGDRVSGIQAVLLQNGLG
jgi:hypothetical protein